MTLTHDMSQTVKGGLGVQAGKKKGLHNVSTKLLKQLIHKLKCAPPTDRQMAAILKDAGVELPATSMTWSEFFLWLS